MGTHSTTTVASAVVAEERTWATNCCGCCCDMRTAVIWVNIVSLILTVPLAMLFVGGTVAMNSVDMTDANSEFYENIEDDQLRDQTIEAMAQMEDSSNGIMAAAISIVVIRMLCSAIGIYGAVKYKVWPVMVSLVAYIVEFVSSAIMLNILGLIMPVFFAYPHFFFIRELKRNVHAADIAENLPKVEMAEVGQTVEPLLFLISDCLLICRDDLGHPTL